jgi:hypothetical protein
MFVEDEELLAIVVYYKKVGRHYIVYNDAVFNAIGLSEDEKAKFQSLTVQARQLTWGLYNDLQETAMVADNLGNRKWNYKVYKENKLRSIIVKWDATTKDEEGKIVKVPVSPKMISKMSPDIAECILNTYDQMTLIDEEEEKKS